MKSFNPAESLLFSALLCQHYGLQNRQSVAEHLALLGERNLLFHHGTDPKALTHFIEGSAKA